MTEQLHEWAVALADAHRNRQAKSHAPQNLSLDEAYQVQAMMLEHLGSDFVGYKAALSAKAAQEVFAVSEPLLGVLTGDSKASSGFALSHMALPMLEVEVGFELAKNVSEPLNLENAVSAIKCIRMAIELAEVAYESRPSAMDLVAGNSAAGRFFRGPALETNSLDEIAIELSLNGETINQGISGSIGSQLELFVFIVNQALTLDYPVRKGMFVMTGSIGQILPAKHGKYVALFTGPDFPEQKMVFNLG